MQGRMDDMRRRAASLAVVLALAVTVGACGDDSSSSGPVQLQWWSYNEPSGAFADAVTYCNKQSNGEYEIIYQKLGSNADVQRQQLVRRLAAEDDSIDMLSMDVIWTPEFAEAKWIKPFPEDVRKEVSEGTLEGSLETATYEGQLYGAPANSNTQLLWYRKDKVKTPPKTWDELIKMAEDMKTKVEVQAAAYEGYTVWINSLIQSAGGEILKDADTVDLESEPLNKALSIISTLANSSAADPSIDNSKEDSGRLAFEQGVADFQINYPFIYPSAAAIKGFQEKIGWAPYPQVDADTPAKAPIGGFNFGVGNYTHHPDEAFDAVACLRNEHNQEVAAVKGGLPPTLESLYENKDFQKDYPFAALIRKSIESGAVRPKTPLYSDLSLALATALSPPADIDVETMTKDLPQILQDALDGKGLN
jgi:multiple sugar transport system substrate-binding protein